jgi:hypothetical protein
MVPGLGIFSSAYVLRDSSGWQITDAGRNFLQSIEAKTAHRMEPTARLIVVPVPHELPPNVTQLAGYMVVVFNCVRFLTAPLATSRRNYAGAAIFSFATGVFIVAVVMCCCFL